LSGYTARKQPRLLRSQHITCNNSKTQITTGTARRLGSPSACSRHNQRHCHCHMGLGPRPFQMQQQISMFEANKQTKQQYNVPTRHSIHTPSYGVKIFIGRAVTPPLPAALAAFCCTLRSMLLYSAALERCSAPVRPRRPVSSWEAYVVSVTPREARLQQGHRALE
jgi:hypothetical protein